MNETTETLANVVVNLGKSFGPSVKREDLKLVYRMKEKLPKTTNKKYSRPIVIRFNETGNSKEDFFIQYLTAVALNKGPTLGTLNLQPVDQRIYVNHHLSASLMAVKNKALVLKKEGKIQKVTTRYNMIRIQKNNEWHKIVSEAQLNSLFFTTDMETN